MGGVHCLSRGQTSDLAGYEVIGEAGSKREMLGTVWVTFAYRTGMGVSRTHQLHDSAFCNFSTL